MIATNGTNGRTMNGAAALAAPQADLGTLPEAPASVTVKVLYRGHDVLFTLRGLDGLSTLSRLDVALTWLESHGATPATTSGGAKPAAAAALAPTCPTHGRPMKAGRKGGWFCPVKVAEDDGAGRPVYCRQRVNGGAS